MTNPATDPFMISQNKGMNSRPRIKVRVVAAKGLPERGANVVTYGTCMAKNKKTSTFRTRDAYDTVNPIWDEPGGQMVMRWVPGDVLLFRVFDKDRSGLMSSLMSSETLVAQCEIRSTDYYPGGLVRSLPLCNSQGYPIQGAYLQVEVQAYGGEDADLGSKFKRMCNLSALDWNTVRSGVQHAPEAIIKEGNRMLGDPAEDRTKGDMAMLIAIPFIIFLFLTWFGWLMRHFNNEIVVMCAGLAFMIALGVMVVGVTTHKKSKKPFFAIGVLMIIAVVSGLLACEHGWNECWRQWWWMHTGRQLGASASTPAEAAADASFLKFDNVKNGTAWTSADTSRAAGYRNGDIYCAAPILDPTLASGDIMRVQYWAIGINCCDNFGSFTCDSSREIQGSVGVVMKGEGMPCFGCHANEFRLAALKSAGVNKLVSAPGALYVRFVSNRKTIENLYLSKCVFSFFWSLILGGLFFGFLGFIVNYKGLGKPGHFPLYHMLDPAKKVPSFNQKPDPNQTAVDEADKKWTLVLTPSPAGGFNMAARKPEDEYATGYGTA